MHPTEFLTRIIDPGLLVLMEFGGPALSANARRMLLAIAMQESGAGLAARYQNSPATTPGPARGFWQFEQGGGCAGVLQHNASANWARRACELCTVQPHAAAVWRALEGHDMLATMFARLLLWTDPAALPAAGQEQVAWAYYLRLWRPGKPHANAWPANWAGASLAVPA